MSSADLIKSALAACPAGVNPVFCIRTAIRELIVPHTPHNYLIHLYFFSALLGVCILLLLLSLSIRGIKNNLWFFRVEEKFIKPHSSNCWSICAILLFGTVEGFIWSRIQTVHGANLHSLGYWVIFPWIFGVTAYHLSGWSLGVSYILHLRSIERTPSSPFATPLFANTFGLLVLFSLGLSIGLMVRAASNEYSVGISAYIELDNMLAMVEAAYNSTHVFDPSSLAAGAPLIAIFAAKFASYTTLFKYTFLCYFMFGLLVEFTLIIIGFLHLRSLRASIDDMHETFSAYEDLQEAEVRVEKAYRGLVGLTVASIITATLFNGDLLFLFVAANSVVHKSIFLQISTLLPIYIFVFCGLPVGIYNLYSSITTPASIKGGKQSITEAPSSSFSGAHAVQLNYTPSIHSSSPMSDIHRSPSSPNKSVMAVTDLMDYPQSSYSHSTFNARSDQSEFGNRREEKFGYVARVPEGGSQSSKNW